jgi:nucleotide-binding universal stress UspA family protein
MRVLIAADESEFSRSALDSVLARPWPDTTEFLILSVVPFIPPAYGDWQLGYASSAREAQSALNTLHHSTVLEFETELRSAFPDSRIEGKVLTGSIRDCIVDEAETWQADLIVMGSHGRTGMSRFLLGSVAESVLGRSPCSVEIIRMPKTVNR